VGRLKGPRSLSWNLPGLILPPDTGWICSGPSIKSALGDFFQRNLSYPQQMDQFFPRSIAACKLAKLFPRPPDSLVPFIYNSPNPFQRSLLIKSSHPLNYRQQPAWVPTICFRFTFSSPFADKLPFHTLTCVFL